MWRFVPQCLQFIKPNFLNLDTPEVREWVLNVRYGVPEGFLSLSLFVCTMAFPFLDCIYTHSAET